MQIHTILNFKAYWLRLCTLMYLLFFADFLYGTTIVPYVNIGEMALASDAVVLAKVQEVYLHRGKKESHNRTQFLVEQAIKGSLSASSTFELEASSGMVGDLYFEMSGDMVYETGHTYLIFLRKQARAPYWEPVLMAYGIFEEVVYEARHYLVPSSEGRSIHEYQRSDGRLVEPLTAYGRDELLLQLSNVANGRESWRSEDVQLSAGLNQRLFEITAAPPHCNFFGSRWLNFPETVLPVYAENDGDATIANFDQRVSAAVTLLGNNYSDINLNYAGTTNYVPNCSAGSGSAYGIGSGFFSALSGDRWILVMFDDPCDQVDDLVIEVTETTFSCEGILARGGLYGLSPGHTHDGIHKNNAAYGYVVVNERAGDCLLGSTTDYEYLIAHEMTHSLGFDHIPAASGVANMNPICCANLTNLDIQCSEYYYGNAILPVELIEFTGKREEDGLHLEWQTASEVNSSHFVIERSADGLHFSPLGTVASVGATDFVQAYRFADQEPFVGINYYRLQQVDFDGTATYSNVLSIPWEPDLLAFSLFPNPMIGGELSMQISAPQIGELDLSLHQLDGKMLKRQSVELEKGENQQSISVRELPAGIYLVKGIFKGQVVCKRLVVQ